jgi:DNA-binding PucR family transcriptional regulator
LILEGTSKQLVQRLVDQRLGALLSYDQEHRTVLVETLETYFAEGQNPRATAAKLHVHANTVYQRLERVDHVLGAAWRDPAHTLEVQLALQLHRVVEDLSLDRLAASHSA